MGVPCSSSPRRAFGSSPARARARALLPPQVMAEPQADAGGAAGGGGGGGGPSLPQGIEYSMPVQSGVDAATLAAEGVGATDASLDELTSMLAGLGGGGGGGK